MDKGKGALKRARDRKRKENKESAKYQFSLTNIIHFLFPFDPFVFLEIRSVVTNTLEYNTIYE